MTAVATANLGRAAARAGRHDDARRLLLQALDGLREIEAGSFVLETEVRLAEAAVLAADHQRALADAHAAAQRTDVAAAPSVQALLHRVLAYAHVQAGELEEALVDLERSLEVARSGDALYEVALTLLARGRLRGDATDIAEAQALLDSLHVVRVLEPPL